MSAGLRVLAPTSQPERPANPETADELEPLLTAAEVAKVLGVRPKRVYELGIPTVRLSAHTLRWRRSQVAAWLRDRETP